MPPGGFSEAGGCVIGGAPVGGIQICGGCGEETGGYGRSGGVNTGYSNTTGADGGCVSAISTNGGGIVTAVDCVTIGISGTTGAPAPAFSGAVVPGTLGLPPPPPNPPTPITPPPGPAIPPPATHTGGSASSVVGVGRTLPLLALSSNPFGFSNFSVATGASARISGDATSCAARTGSSIAFSAGSTSTGATGPRGVSENRFPQRPRTSVLPSVRTCSPAASVTMRRVQ